MTRNIVVIPLAITALLVTRLALRATPVDYGAPDPCDVRLSRLSAEAAMLRAAGR